MAITAATPAKSRKESRTHQCAINSQTGYTRIQVLHFGNGTSLGAQPGLPGGRGRQSTSIRCPGQSNKYGVPGKTRNGVCKTFQLCPGHLIDRKSTRLNSSHITISYAVFCLKKKKKKVQKK